MVTKTITLEDLRQSPQPSWLWDGARARIVWANGAGVAAFDGQSVFDLVDRPFDPREAGVARIAEMTNTLSFGESRRAELNFPSTGLFRALACTCHIHALADGRPGVLVIADAPVAALGEAPAPLAALALAKLPMAIAVLAADGALLHANDAARRLLPAENARTLAGLVGDPERARVLLARRAEAGLVSSIERMAGPLGIRDIRLTLSPIASDAIALVMEDVTDRRALERNLADTPPTVSPAPKAMLPELSTADAFAKLARSLAETIREQGEDPRPPSPPPAASPPPPPAPAPEIPRPFIPETVRASLEQMGEAIVIGRDAHALFATSQAAALLHYPGADAVIADRALWQKLSETQPCARVSLTTPAQQALDIIVARSAIPWHNGPAQQFVLRGAPPATPEELPPLPASRPMVAEAPAPAPIAVSPPPAPEPPPATTPPPDRRDAIASDELKAILDVASDGIITLDRDGRILSFSAGAESIFGLSISEVVDRPFADLLSPESRRAMRDYLAALNGPGLASVFNDGREVTAIVRQGGSVPLFLTIGRLQSPHSRAAYCAVVRDITHWKRTEKDLREAKEAAEAASRQKSDFLARISHELRTPLNAIMGFSEVMRLERFGEIKNEKYRGYVHDIHASGSHLLALINDLLDLSKVEAGKLELNFAAVSIADAADHAIRLLQEEAALARIVVRTALPPNLPRVVADLRSMRQILLNLLSNAIKYTNPGGEVIISAAAEKNGDLSLRIKDTGIGMDAAQLKDAFLPFTRVATSDRERQGTGLGLPLTKALVEANRAGFSIASDPGRGTQVEIRFPVTRVLAE